MSEDNLITVRPDGRWITPEAKKAWDTWMEARVAVSRKHFPESEGVAPGGMIKLEPSDYLRRIQEMQAEIRPIDDAMIAIKSQWWMPSFVIPTDN